MFIVAENIFSVACLFCSVRIKFSYYNATAVLACLEYTVEKHSPPLCFQFMMLTTRWKSQVLLKSSMKGNICESGALYGDPVATVHSII